MTAAEASKIILNIVEFLGSPISVWRFRSSEFHVQLSTLHSSGFCAPPDLNWGLNFLLCHPKIDFLRDCQKLEIAQLRSYMLNVNVSRETLMHSPYFPIQNCSKIRSRISGLTISPVISRTAVTASFKSIATSSAG